ncbi:hypothetical protein KBP30_39685 [Streptomyces sp. Go40/10]|uniref:hypothetical protein n=1 Tax=Streptomyces sp. Go40/10 TaxID=2825844 RepID=UPI001E48B293|nr:hypothetical protein [Streptomyces sp. Go40/10]UFR06921.1 hypothetical protein KBP30_39685 [Streptomyces sp. Go40/10]
MTLSAASDASTTWVPLGVSVAALAGVIFTPVYSKRKEVLTQRKEKLLDACEVFETACDALQDDFAHQMAALLRSRRHPSNAVSDLSMPWEDWSPPDGYEDVAQPVGVSDTSDVSWHTVNTVLNKAERAARRIGHFDKTLFSKAQAVHRSLRDEVQAIKGGPQPTGADLRMRWEQARERSDRLRHEFTMAVAKQT